MLSLSSRLVLQAVLLVCLGCALCTAAGPYSACLLGDAACDSQSNFNDHCCPVGAEPSFGGGTNGAPTTYFCTGGVPAGCAATGNGQPTMGACSSNSGACSPLNTAGCKSFSMNSGSTQQIGLAAATGYSSCPTGARAFIRSLTIVTSSKGGNSFTASIADYSFPGGPPGVTSSVVIRGTSTSSGCYTLSLPYQIKTDSSPLVVLTCSASGGCAGTVQADISCVEAPTEPLCLSGPTTAFIGLSSPCTSNPSAFTANDGNQYCCNTATIAPTFGTRGGLCFCPPAVNGGWSDWSACDVSSCTEARTCTMPSPSGGGASCVGDATRTCTANACSANGGGSSGSNSGGNGASSSSGGTSGQSAYDPSVWLGTYTISAGCDQSQCCCARTSTITANGDGSTYTISGTNVAGNCGSSGDVPNAIVTTTAIPTSNVASYTFGGKIHTVTRDSVSGGLNDQYSGDSACSATLVRTASVNDSGAARASWSRSLFLLLAVLAVGMLVM